MYTEGGSLSATGRVLGSSAQGVSRWVKIRTLTGRGGLTAFPQTPDFLLQLAGAGLSGQAGVPLSVALGL